MKITWDKQYLKYSLYAALTIALSIIIYQVLDNAGHLLNKGGEYFRFIRSLLRPFIIGGFVAYLLNPGVRWFEKRVYSRIESLKNRNKLIRVISILTIYFIFIGFITIISLKVAPQIAQNIRDISRRVPEYFNYTSNLITQWINELQAESIYNFSQHVERNIREIFNKTSEILDYVLNNVVISIMSITSGILNFILALIIAFYMLMDKESFKEGVEKLLSVVMLDESVIKIKDFGREADELFGKFIVGKSIDSFIIGCMCLIGLSLMNIRYALLLAVMVGITNMIPYFGPFIGGVPAVLVTFFDSPVKALWVILFILALQQFDGLFLGPKILGDSVGLSPFWIIFSIVVGGGIAGVLGMFLGVPIFAIIRLLTIRIIDKQLEKKKNRTKRELT